MNESEKQSIQIQLGSTFTPGAPIDNKDLFSGRIDQINQIISAITQKGFHGILYGERGVGKTSLSMILQSILNANHHSFSFLRTNCDASDNYSSIWKKIFENVTLNQTSKAIGYMQNDNIETFSLLEKLPSEITPNIVKNALNAICQGKHFVIVFDEFDRINNEDRKLKKLVADTIKLLSDSGINATILLIGVADSVDELIDDHNSIERALMQIPMPRMSSSEIKEIIDKGLKRVSMEIEEEPKGQIISLSQGLPYITHLISLHSAKNAINNNRAKILSIDVEKGVSEAIEQSNQSLKSSYYKATKSHQPDNIFKEVFLACALAETDEMDCFTAAAIRKPLHIITGKQYKISSFARHLKKFTEDERGSAITMIGKERKRYRFSSPILKPFAIMNGFKDKVLDKEKIKLIKKKGG